MENGGDIEDDVPPIVYVIAGCVAGAIETIGTWPTEYIKTKLQLQQQSQEDAIKIRRGMELAAAAAAAKSEYVPPASCEKGYIHHHAASAVEGEESMPTNSIAFHTIELTPSAGNETSYYERSDSVFVCPTVVTCVEEAMLDDPPLMLLPYTDMISGVLYTIKTLGFFALYYGLTPTLLGSIPKAGIRFGMFAWFSHLLQDDDGVTSAEMTFLAGCMAGVIEALLVVVPVETIKTKCIQMDVPFWDGLRRILLLEGIGGVYTGGLATVIKQSSNHGLRFVWYGEYKSMVTNNGEYAMTPLMTLFGGMTAGIFSALGNQPADVIKTRMQGVCAEYTSTWDCIRKTYEGGRGISGFYTGIVPRLARVVPGQGILFLSYEVVVSALLSFYYS